MESSNRSKENKRKYPDDELVVEKWLSKMKTVDMLATSLAMSLDTMHATADALIQYLQHPHSSLQDESIGTATSEQHLSLQLLVNTEKSVLHDKLHAMKSLQDFLHFTRNSLGYLRAIPEQEVGCLSLDAYLSECDESKPVEPMSVRIMEEMKQENKRLREDLTFQRQYEDDYNKEKVTLIETIKGLEKENDILQSQIVQKDRSSFTQVETILKGNRNVEHLSEELNKMHMENKQLKKDLENLNLENDVLTDSIEAYNSVEEESKSLKAENSRLGKELSELKISQRTDQEKATKDINDLSKEIERLKAEKCADNEMIKLTSDHQQLQHNYTIQKQAMETKEQEIKKMVLKVKEVESLTVSKVKEVESLTAEIKMLKKETVEIKSKNKQMQLKLDDLGQNSESLVQKNKKLEEEIVKNKILHETKEYKIEEMKQQISDLDAEKANLKCSMEDATKAMRVFEAENLSIKEENMSLKHELEAYKSKKLIKVQLLYQRRGELILKVEDNLVSLLKSRMEKDAKLELEFIKCNSTSDVNPNIPLLLLCISASRIGTDAAVTVQGLNLTSKMALLIFHHKDEHALPNQASYQVLTGKEFTMLGGICDMAFLTGKGIYSCAMNDTSMEKIVNFITSQ